MNTLTKQIVYLPVKGFKTPAEEEGYFFTPEQLNEYTANVIKQALETAAENADAYIKIEPNDQPSSSFGNFEYPAVKKKSITNTFDITFQKYKV